jgi:hypothetical protein
MSDELLMRKETGMRQGTVHDGVQIKSNAIVTFFSLLA